MIATHVSSKRFRNPHSFDVVQHVFTLDPPRDGHGTITISLTNDDSVDRTIVYAGTEHLWGADHLYNAYTIRPVAEVLEALGYTASDPALPGLPSIPMDAPPCLRAMARWRCAPWRVGDVLIANADAADLGLAEDTRVRIVDTRYQHLTLETLGGDESRVIECSSRHPGLRPARYRWTVEIEMDAKWVADGADLTDRKVQNIIERAFPYCSSREVTARPIDAPDPEDVAREQGYTSAAEMMNARNTRCR